MRQSEYDILARNWEYAESAARSSRQATSGLPGRVARALQRLDGDELSHPVGQDLLLRLQMQAIGARNVILVCDDSPSLAVALYSALLSPVGQQQADGPRGSLTIVCSTGRGTALKTILSLIDRPSADSGTSSPARLRIAEAAPRAYLTRLTANSYDALVAAGSPANYQAAYGAAASLLRRGGLLLLTDSLASADNPSGGVTNKVDRGEKTVAMRTILSALHDDRHFETVLTPVGTGLTIALHL